MMTPERKWHWFRYLWVNNSPFCRTCGNIEGRCMVSCRRLILTKKYRLVEEGKPSAMAG